MSEKIVTSHVSNKIAKNKKLSNIMLLLILASFVFIIIGLSTNTIFWTIIGIDALVLSGEVFMGSNRIRNI